MEIMERLAVATEEANYLFVPNSPDVSREYGQWHMTFLHHPVFAVWMRELFGGFDASLQLELVNEGGKLKGRSVSTNRTQLKDKAFDAPFASEAEAEIRWIKPPHDPAFLARAVPAVYRDQTDEFEGFHGAWRWQHASSPADGLFVLHGDIRMLAVLNMNRFPVDVNGAQILEDADAMLIDISPEGNGEERFHRIRDIQCSCRSYGNHLLLTLAAKYGIQLPQPIERRYFFWQTYLEGIQQPRFRG
ncbi:MAG: hypothetical protein RDU25_01115 [Patescibacteria group bacterium]|nr:hypothetical protein [Patescibacteria group bacterium]